MHSESLTVGAKQVSQETLEAIFKLTLSGSTPEAISLALDLNVQTVKQVIARESKNLHKEGSQCKQDTRDDLHEVPTFIYSYKPNTDQLHRTSLVTGEHSTLQVPSYTFKWGCCWSEVPGGSLLITGGGYPTVGREVVRIDTRREFAVSHCLPMLTHRKSHAAVYHTPHLYILGGWNYRYLSECERYVCAENRWEALPPLHRTCYSTSGVVVESSLYVLGGMLKQT
jgi:hypothetical protein